VILINQSQISYCVVKINHHLNYWVDANVGHKNMNHFLMSIFLLTKVQSNTFVCIHFHYSCRLSFVMFFPLSHLQVISLFCCKMFTLHLISIATCSSYNGPLLNNNNTNIDFQTRGGHYNNQSSFTHMTSKLLQI
jgi:hypothetical protein